MKVHLISALAFVASAAHLANAQPHELKFAWSFGAPPGEPTLRVIDNGPDDLNPALHHVEYDFDFTGEDGDRRWNARGTVLGIATPGGDAATTISDLIITKTAGIDLAIGSISFEHVFPIYDPHRRSSAEFIGHFDSLLTPGSLGGAGLGYRADSFNSLGPVLPRKLLEFRIPITAGDRYDFSETSEPIADPWAVRHKGSMDFYLDTVGDSIFVNEPGETLKITSFIPTPGSLVPLFAVVLPLSRRRRCST